MANLDVEQFISEVKKYPELWDVQSGDHRFIYQNKQKVWPKIASAIIENFDEFSKEDKLDVYAKLSTRWRNMRDSYVRYLRKGKDYKKTYRYAKELSFLENRYKDWKPRARKRRRKLSSEVAVDEWMDDDSKGIDFKQLDPKEETIWAEEMMSSKKLRNNDLNFVEINDNSLQSAIDDDKSFFDSVLPAIRHFDLDQKLEFRSDVLKLVTQYRKQGSTRRSEESE